MFSVLVLPNITPMAGCSRAKSLNFGAVGGCITAAVTVDASCVIIDSIDTFVLFFYTFGVKEGRARLGDTEGQDYDQEKLGELKQEAIYKTTTKYVSTTSTHHSIS